MRLRDFGNLPVAKRPALIARHATGSEFTDGELMMWSSSHDLHGQECTQYATLRGGKGPRVRKRHQDLQIGNPPLVVVIRRGGVWICAEVVLTAAVPAPWAQDPPPQSMKHRQSRPLSTGQFHGWLT